MIMKHFNRRRLKLVLSFTGATLLLSLGFQNCAKFNANSGEGFGSSSSFLPSSANGVTVTGPLTPDVATISPTDTLQITQSNDGGSGNYQLIAGAGSVDPLTGVFTPAGATTDAIIGRPDSNNNWTYTFVKVTSSTSSLALSPAAALIAPSKQVKFSAAGGQAPYTYTLSASHASVDSGTGLFTAGAVEETVVVTATDANGKIAQSSLEVKNSAVGMAVLHAPNPMIAGNDVTFVVVGGTAPYTLQLLSGSGTVNGQVYTPSLNPENASFKITDSMGQVITLNSSVIDDPSLPAVVAGATTFSTPGTYSFTVPNFVSMSVSVKGAGGGGGGTGYNSSYYGHAGTAGTVTSFGSLIANAGGGGNGGGWFGYCGATGAAGTASGDSSATTGGGNAGGSPGGWGLGDCGGYGGAGGSVSATYTRSTLARGTVITIVIGSGGTGGLAGSGSGGGVAGANGSVTITVN